MTTPLLKTFEIEVFSDGLDSPPRLKTFEIEVFSDGLDSPPRLKTFEIEAPTAGGYFPTPGTSPVLDSFEAEAADQTQPPESPTLRALDVQASFPDQGINTPATVKLRVLDIQATNVGDQPPVSPILRILDVTAGYGDPPPIRTLIRQQTQGQRSDTYDDTLSISGAESGAVTVENDLNYLRSVLKELKGTTNWFDASPDTVTQLASDTTLSEKKILYRIQFLPNITVPNGQNYVVMGSGEYPTNPIAIGASTEGAVVAQLAGAIGSHSLMAATNNSNLVHIREADTNDAIYDSSGRTVYGLLQVGSAATDGNSFSGSGDDQAQVSFVTINPVTEALEACAIGDIEDEVIEYGYLARSNLRDMPENVLDTTFVSADPETQGDVTLDDAYNGGSDVLVDNTDVEWRLADTKSFKIQDVSQVDLFSVDAAAGGDSIVFSAIDLEINSSSNVDVNAGLSVDTGSTPILLGSGEVTTSGAISLASSGLTASLSGDDDTTVVSSAGEVYLDDSRTAAIPLSDASNTTLYGGASSLLGAINTAGASGGVSLVVGRVVVDAGGIAANSTVTALNTSVLSDSPGGLVAYSGVDEFTDSLLIFLNGELVANGVGSASNNDVYPAGNAADGEMAFEFDLMEGDLIQVLKLV